MPRRVLCQGRGRDRSRLLSVMSVSRASGKITNIPHVSSRIEPQLSKRCGNSRYSFFFRDFAEVPFDYSPPHSFVSLLFPAEGMRRASGSGWTVPEQSKRVSTRVKGLWNDTNGLAKRVLNTVHSGSPAQVPGAAGQARGRKRGKRESLKGGLVVLGGDVGEGRGVRGAHPQGNHHSPQKSYQEF